MDGRAQSIIEGAELPSVPHVLQEILVRANDPSCSSSDLADVIRGEPGLVTKMLRTVNSAYYSFARQISSIDQAIVLLGHSTVRSLAAGLALVDAFNSLPGLNRRFVLAVWRHSLTAAGIVTVLAASREREVRNVLFLGAMVQNVGHLVLSQYFQGEYDALLESGPFPACEDESARFGVDHAAVGAALLAAWKFPEEVVQLVLRHHAPDAGQVEHFKAACLEAGDLLSRNWERLADALEREPLELEADLETRLLDLGWSREDLQAERERLLQAASLSGIIGSG